MKNLAIGFVSILVSLYLATSEPANGRDVNGDGVVRIDRSSTLESGELDRASQRAIAEVTGDGEFLVRTAKIRAADSPLEHARIFFVFSSRDALRNNEPSKRIFSTSNISDTKIEAGDDGELVNYLLELLPDGSLDEKTAYTIIPGILSAALYANTAQLWPAQYRMLSDVEFEKVHACDPAERAELKALCLDPVLTRGSDGRLVWKGRFVLRGGGVEDVTITLPSNLDRGVKLKRLEVRPRNYPRDDSDEIVGVEEWVVSRESNWHPSRRDSFTLTLASLGNSKAKYQLGLALMDEYDVNAKAEGIKWLRAAAADGYGDAVTRVAVIDADSRTLRDRESMRKDNCCRLPR